MEYRQHTKRLSYTYIIDNIWFIDNIDDNSMQLKLSCVSKMNLKNYINSIYVYYIIDNKSTDYSIWIIDDMQIAIIDTTIQYLPLPIAYLFFNFTKTVYGTFVGCLWAWLSNYLSLNEIVNRILQGEWGKYLCCSSKIEPALARPAQPCSPCDLLYRINKIVNYIRREILTQVCLLPLLLLRLLLGSSSAFTEWKNRISRVVNLIKREREREGAVEGESRADFV